MANFDPGQPVPKTLPGRTFLACVTDIFMVVIGAAVQSRPLTSKSAAALTAYYSVVVVLLLNGRVVLAHPRLFSSFSNSAEQLALAAGGLIVYAEYAQTPPHLAGLLSRIGRRTFGLCVVLFGFAHFVYMEQTAPLVPKWLPFPPVFWAEATGVAQIAAGLSVISGLQRRLAAILLTTMYAAFTPLVHLPLLFAAPHNVFYWTENALNVALVGVAWVVVDLETKAVGAEGVSSKF